MELKWTLAMGLEAGFWMMLAAFLVLRYRYGIEGITRLFVIGVVIDTAGIVALGVWDFASTGRGERLHAVHRGADRVQPDLGQASTSSASTPGWRARSSPRRARRRSPGAPTSRPCPDRL